MCTVTLNSEMCMTNVCVHLRENHLIIIIDDPSFNPKNIKHVNNTTIPQYYNTY